MDDEFVISVNFNMFESYSWIERRLQPDGSYSLVGMGRKVERAPDGSIVSNVTAPTEVKGTAPSCAFGERRTLLQWFHGFMWGKK